MTPELPEGYEVRISHFRNVEMLPDYDTRIRPDRANRPLIAITIAEIYRISDDSLIASGQSHCSASDPFNKKRGRDIATGRAIKDLNQILNTSVLDKIHEEWGA